MICIKEFRNNKILIDMNDTLPEVITLIHTAVLMKLPVKDGCKFYPQLFLDDEFYD